MCSFAQWWSQSGSNRRPPACKAGALPAELWPHAFESTERDTELRHAGLCSLDAGHLCGRLDRQLSCLYVSKEVIQPHLPIRLPCYDFTPVMNHTVVTVLPKVRLATSGATHSHGVTGGVYKARERIHRDMLIRDY